MPAGRVNFGSWLLRLLVWDGALPAAIMCTPAVIKLLLPNNRGAIEITAVLLPIVAFLVRFRVGKRHINSNSCSRRVQILQLFVFCIGIFVLLFVDAIFVLSHIMPKGVFTVGDFRLGAVAGATYLTVMAIAMYPGRTEVYDESWEY